MFDIVVYLFDVGVDVGVVDGLGDYGYGLVDGYVGVVG